MAQLKVNIDDSVLARALEHANRLWPGHGHRGLHRLIRDAVRRYLRYSGGKDKRNSTS